MRTFNSYRLTITPLSPVHIGSGESYEPTNYVIDDGVLHEFDTGAVMQVMTKTDREQLLALSNGKPGPDMIEALQLFFFERRNLLMGYALQRIPVLRGVADLYEKRIGRPANRETDGKSVINRLEIDRTCFDSITRLPVLYGSSLKGAIRTALLDEVNDGKPAHEKKGLHEFQGRLFKYRNPETGKLGLEKDPMRLVQLSDAVWPGEAGLFAAQVYLAVNRKKEPVKDKQGNLRKSQAESKELYQILECVSAWRYRSYTCQLNLQTINGMEKYRRDIPASDFLFNIVDIARACNAFYKPILESENLKMRERGYLDMAWDKEVQLLLRSSAERLQSGNAFLLRVGRHSGAESVTLNGVRKIKIKGRGPEYEISKEAKTSWLAAEDKNQTENLLPFGWVMVEVHPLNDEPRDWPELKIACEPHIVAARALAVKLEKKRATIAQTRDESEAKRREEEEKARVLAEEERRKHQAGLEQQARLAAMPPNMRRIEEFTAAFVARVSQLRGGKDRQNTEYHDRARKLAKDAMEGADWTVEEKRAAADAIEQWLPKVVQDIDKHQLKKLNLSALRGVV